VRTVFHDLPTAHSSITSGTARSRQRAPSNSNTITEAYEEEDSIPLQELEPPKRTKLKSSSFIHELPLLPFPAAIAQHRLNKRSTASDSCLVAEDYNFVSSQKTKQTRDKSKQPQYPLQSSSIYHTSAGAAPSSSLFPTDSRPSKDKYESYSVAIPFPDLGSTPAPQEGNHPLPRQSSKATRAVSNTGSSLPEGSTVGNIYKHYVRSQIFDDIDSVDDDVHSECDMADGYPPTQGFGKRAIGNGLSSDFLSNDQLQQSALNFRKQRRAERLTSRGQPPTSDLPSIPNPSSCLLPSVSQGIEPSSSYGDTQNLLELTEQARFGNQPTLSCPTGKNYMFGQEIAGLGNLTQRNFPYLSANNPFGGSNGPQIHVSQANDENYDSDDYRSHRNDRDQDRQPLEREVSQALRRASNFSAYSDGSIATSVVEVYRNFQSEASSSNELETLRRHIEISPPSEPEIDEESRAAAAYSEAFYDRDAIPRRWIANDQQNLIRVPIQHHSRFPNSPPISPEDEINSQREGSRDESELDDDVNDWETVGGSGFGNESAPAMLGEGMAHRAGSSIADTSDEGTLSTYIPVISEYGSTERIAQHPGNVEYSGDYRQRDLKKTNIPIFLPVYGEHKVNGYLADSNRLRAPPNPYNHTPRPLERKHINPFKSPPPEITTKASGSKPYSSMNRRHHPPKPYHFPSHASIKTNSSTDENDITGSRMASAHPYRSGGVENFSRPFNWMDDFGDPGPAINSNRDFLKPIPPVAEPEDRPSSWGHIIAFARGESVEGYNADGTRITDSPLGRGFMRERSFSGHPLSAVTNQPTDGFVERKTYGGKHGPSTQKERSTLVKGPPGAFYHGLSRPKPDRSQSNTERPRKFKPTYRQSSANEYPTNGLRTLSLVANRKDRPVTPIVSVDSMMDLGPDPSLSSRPNDFVYRSPLAPPKRKTWQQLYTQKQLSEFRETAQVGRVFESRGSRPVELNAGLLDGREDGRDFLKQESSRKHLGEVPRLWGGQQPHRGTRFYQEPIERICTDQPKKKKQISIFVLCLCNLIFPMLLLFHKDKLDWIMLWWTTGEFYSFGKPQKTVALYCFVGWCIATFIGLIVFLIWWFAIR
jgi:hypothetical protein